MAYTTIDDPEAYFQVKKYAGDSTNHAITFDGDTDMQPDAVWIKETDDTINHYLYDSVRGVAGRLQVNINNAASATDSTWFQSFDSDGFSIGSEDNINDTGDNYVAWCWKESATAGFDILTFEGNATDDTDISHNLSAVPHFMIVRNFDAAKEWVVYHHKNTSAPETDQLVLDTNAATADSDDKWSDEVPTSSVFTVGDSSQLNASGETSIAYLWSEKQGFSKFGTYTGNGAADGTFVFCGFRPSYVLGKRTSATENWFVFDTKRNPFNPSRKYLYPDGNNAESNSGDRVDILSNGFKFTTTSAQINGSGSTYIYVAFAEAPFANSKGVPCNAR